VFFKESKHGPEDWDLCVAVQYKNWAALDGLSARGEAVRDKVLGGKSQLESVMQKRAEIREIISSELMEEVTLK